MDKKGKEKAMARNLVFIFKAVKENGVNDKYEEILEFNRIPFAVIPVLSFGFVNKENLTSHLSQPNELSAIILTSTRAVEAVVSAVQDLSNCTRDLLASVQCFVVGPATYDAAVAAGFKPEGQESGNGSALAGYIIENIKDPSKTLLFPCSNIRKENIPEILKSKGFMITEITAYETYPDEHIGEYVKQAVDTKGFPQYAIFFSPSGFKHVHDFASTFSFALEHTKIIALGPSTAATVTDKGYKLYGTTEKPEPESLLHLLQKSMACIS